MAALIAGETRARVAAATEAFLRVYAQILFSRSPAVGLVLLSATAMVPRAFMAGAVAVLAATITAVLLDLDPEAIRAGDYGYGALLVGLGIGQMFILRTEVAFLLVFAAAASVLVTAALKAWLGAVSLPVLSLPFVMTLYLVLGVAGFAGAEPRINVPETSSLGGVIPPGVALFVRSLGGLFFLPRLDSGALVLAALLLHSRIAATLAAAAFTVALWVTAGAAALPAGASVEVLGYNAMFTALALGGVFFVPSTSSFALALGGAGIAVMSAVALAGPFARMGLPLSILPFNLTVLVVLFALRQRIRDVRPKSVDFLPGTPEENLAYFRTRRSRFQWLHAVAFQLPVRGRWTVTQGENGAHTHRGIWKYAFDFEVRDAEGHLAQGDGSSVEQYHCFRLPVLAAAEGTVVAIENGVPDNEIGGLELDRNWGNHVLIQHGIGLYSLVAHLARGSVKVVKGQVVRRGEILGACGSSGRSPRPHLHFQLQSTAELGAPTLPCRFTDVVVDRGDGERLLTASTPREGDVVRNLAPGEDVASYFDVEVGRRLAFRIGKAVERVAVEADLYGRLVWRSLDRPATLFHGRSEAFFTAYDAVGAGTSMLHLARTALPRVPFEASEALSWTDHLPARHFRPWLTRALWDVLSPFLPRDGIEMDLRMRREGATLVVEGASRRCDRRGAPVVRTRAELLRGVGPVRVSVTVRGKTRSAERIAMGEEGSRSNDHGGRS
ncbi:secreted peptidase [Minicystis rosea]|nr:secreted peptidase [Minicystis rosea]